MLEAGGELNDQQLPPTPHIPNLSPGCSPTAPPPLVLPQVLKQGDVLTALNGTPVSDDGTMLFSGAVRIDFRHLVSLNFHGDTCQVGALRLEEWQWRLAPTGGTT